MSNKYLCIHGHFYQPPRENPWLNIVERQESAFPFHDWNERITKECYKRNSASRILDQKGRIINIINNYSLISFNFGPTLLSWLEIHEPEVYQAILDADQRSMERFSGHGSAIAQVFNHMIMPLANEKDKQTQVIWGIKDFEMRFKRMPEGMWLAETAADIPTLEVLADNGIKYTILSPYQADKVRKSGEEKWKDASNGKVNPKRPYIINLPSGKNITVFFYDGPVSQGIAFEKLLDDGKAFAGRLLSTYAEDDHTELMNIATDGETYGHHHRHGEMALSYALHHIRSNDLANITIYGEYLEKFPPEHEAMIIEPSSWSCAHGVERWKSDCGCNTGGHADWTQEWRKPLREAFDWLKQEVTPFFEKEMQALVKSPWEVRNDYIRLINNREEENIYQFIDQHAAKKLSEEQCSKMLKLLEMDYHTMLMYTSCGWFFDEVSGIETMQDIAYAARAVQLAKRAGYKDLENEFIERLQMAKSNKPSIKDAGNAYINTLKPQIVDMLRVGSHYAISSLFDDHHEKDILYNYSITTQEYDYAEAGKNKLAVGKAEIKSGVTWDKSNIVFAVLHIGDHQLFGGVNEYDNDNKLFATMREEIMNSFNSANIFEVMYSLDKYFGSHNYSFWHLFRDDQERILNLVIQDTLTNVDNTFIQLFENHYPLMQAVQQLNITFPPAFRYTAEYVFNLKVLKLFSADVVDMDELRQVSREIKSFPLSIDNPKLNIVAANKIAAMMADLENNIDNIELMNIITEMLAIINRLPVSPDWYEAQNTAFKIKKANYENRQAADDKHSKQWCEMMKKLFEQLNMNV